MGLQEALMAVGVVILLAALIYGAMRGKRRRRDQAAADAATRCNFKTAEGEATQTPQEEGTQGRWPR
jgi:hypothetical protein